MRPLSSALLLGLLLAVLERPAQAAGARRPYIFSYEAPSMAAGDVELETWLDYLSKRAPIDSEWRWYVGPRWTPIEGFEVAALTAFTQDLQKPATDANSSVLQLWSEQVELRYLLHTFDSVGSFTIEADGRISIANDLPFEVQPSLAWSKRAGRFGFVARAGYARGFAGPSGVGKFGDDVGVPLGRYDWITWRAGASVDAVQGEIAPILQLGVEGMGEGTLDGLNDLTGLPQSTVNVGPTLSVARGRFWLTIGSLIGLTHASPGAYTRAILGVSL